ncbi:hypothetical protein Javan249_0006 [Streptococcus phage Javan249]|uniref:DUF739 family protein n=1 Tax=Streptococcus halotolerans TaxID=1814128 RepID=UPI0007896670|nr:DUF739 family protein [Streptococcus halotolerans]QBX16372.1 hypothetical protein Javan249_0006 [Streptococcus phage Javan249]
MAYDYSKLNGKIVERFKTQYNFANAMGLSERTVSLKLNNQRYWKNNEISKASELLGISDDEISLYFFDLKV